jgi:peptidoglycan hydrolase CwlO-like protein
MLRRLIGLILILAAIGGLLISVLGLVGIWRIQPDLTKNLQASVDLIGQTLETTAQGLTVTKDALTSSVETIGNLQATIETTASTISSTQPMLDEISRMMKSDLPNTIQATQQSLFTAQQSAQVIDSVLRTLSSIPLIGSSIGYNPEVPLSDALGEVAQSLQGLPDSFTKMADSMKTTQSNVQTFEADLTVMAGSIGEIQTSVAEYEKVIGGYQASLDQVQAQLDTLSNNLPQIVRTAVIGLTVFLVWLAIAQIGLFTQGWELLTERAPRGVKPDAEEEEKAAPKERGEEVTSDDQP